MGEHLKKSAEHFEDKVKNVADDLPSKLEQYGIEAKNMASRSLNVLKDEANDLYKKGEKTVSEVGGQVHGLMRAKPMSSLLLTLGVGLGVGMLLGSMSRKSK